MNCPGAVFCIMMACPDFKNLSEAPGIMYGEGLFWHELRGHYKGRLKSVADLVPLRRDRVPECRRLPASLRPGKGCIKAGCTSWPER